MRGEAQLCLTKIGDVPVPTTDLCLLRSKVNAPTVPPPMTTMTYRSLAVLLVADVSPLTVVAVELEDVGRVAQSTRQWRHLTLNHESSNRLLLGS